MTYMNTRTLTLRISEELMTELDEEARERNLSISEVARERLEGRKRFEPFTLSEGGSLEPSGADVQVNLKDPGASIVTPTCSHPKARLRQTVKGKRCLDCGKDV
jgi:hypothetical protein